MCRYGRGDGYHDTYVCLDCRTAFQGGSWTRLGSVHCPHCGKLGENIGKDYRVPRKTQDNQWKKLEVLLQARQDGLGSSFRSCGCRGLGPLPKTFADAKRASHKVSQGDLAPSGNLKPRPLLDGSVPPRPRGR